MLKRGQNCPPWSSYQRQTRKIVTTRSYFMYLYTPTISRLLCPSAAHDQQEGWTDMESILFIEMDNRMKDIGDILIMTSTL
jgi:hypothetical protein